MTGARRELLRGAVALRSRAWRSARAVARAVGLDLIRRADEELFHVARRRLLEERAVGVVLDVGANEGQYGRTLRADGYAGRIVSFEPLSRAFDELRRRAAPDEAWTCHRLALGPRDGEAAVNVAGNSLSSSLLAMLPLHVEVAPASAYVGRETVQVARLDSLRGEVLGSDARAHLKLDVQGYEFEVLDGAAETLAHTETIESELSLDPLYEGQPLFVDVVGRLDREGFDLVALERAAVHPRTGRIMQLNGLFVRRAGA